jgi:hypothetical protein
MTGGGHHDQGTHHVTDLRSAGLVDPTEASTAQAQGTEADLRRELQEALEYRNATNDILRVISRSAFDLSSILETVVTSAVPLCRAEMSVLFRYQDGAYRFAVGYGLTPEHERLERE